MGLYMPFQKKVVTEEVKVDNVPQTVSDSEAIAEVKIAKDEKNFKVWLKQQPKVPIHIPENPMNPGEVVPVGLNGVVYAIPTGQDFEVPKPIYDVWKYAHEETRAANQQAQRILNKELKILD